MSQQQPPNQLHQNQNMMMGQGMGPLPPPPPALMYHFPGSSSADPVFQQLRRDWEHAFHVQSLQGKGTEHLQQLMHSQFTFLEHVVLDVSKQCHSLQDQLTAERSANQKLALQIEDIQRQSSQLKQPIIELENRFVKLDANHSILQSQQKGLDNALNTHGAVLQSKIDEKNHIEKDAFTRIVAEMEKMRAEMAEMKKAADLDKQQRTSEKTAFDAAMEEAKKQIESVRVDIMRVQAEVLRAANEAIDQTSSGLERHLSTLKHSHHTEQQTILSVIKTMTSNITTIRKEIHRLEHRNQIKLEELKDAIMFQFKQEVKTVSRPLIVH